jgi:endo-1,4-beta-xylanase
MTTPKLFTRRNAIYLGLGALTGIGGSHLIQEIEESYALDRRAQRDFRVRGASSLKQRAARKGIIYGADAGTFELRSKPPLQRLLQRECAMLVPGFVKWDSIHPRPNRFSFVNADWYVNFARKNRMLMRGHTLVWHESLPPWFNETVNRQNARQFLETHIRTVAGRYAGKMQSWDVVNEAILVEDGHPRGLRKSPWLDLLGEDYIDLSFRLAAKADPKALLTYNDYDLEYDTPEQDAKREAVLKLLQGLKSRGTPLHAFGIQSHLYGHERRFNPKKLREFLRDVASLGLKIFITELDVIDQNLPADIQTRDRIVAAAYEDYLSAALDERAVKVVISFGMVDSYTWLAHFRKRRDGAAVRPLAYDRRFGRKLAWNAIARAFDNAPKR